MQGIKFQAEHSISRDERATTLLFLYSIGTGCLRILNPDHPAWSLNPVFYRRRVDGRAAYDSGALTPIRSLYMKFLVRIAAGTVVTRRWRFNEISDVIRTKANLEARSGVTTFSSRPRLRTEID
jgi:hypothetical protein